MTLSHPETLRDLHQDLVQKYKVHGARVDEIWRSLSKSQRKHCMQAGATDGEVLKHPLDISLGAVYKFIPEWNLRDISEPGSDFFLELLKHIATTTLVQQYCGFNGGLGDYHHIVNVMDRTYLRHADSFEDCYTFFIDEKYGVSIKLSHEKEKSLAVFAPAVRANVCVPQSFGQLVLDRQMMLLQCLNVMAEDVLRMGPRTKDQQQSFKNDEGDGLACAFSSLSVRDTTGKIELRDLVASARDRMSALEERVDLLRTESIMLAHAVNAVFFSRPDLVPDEKGRVLPVHTDKFIGAAFFDAVDIGIQAGATWAYITRCIELLEGSTNKAYRGTILQELSNVCHLQYSRAQAQFKRHPATGSGSKRFRRIANQFDKAGNSRLHMKVNVAELTRSDPQCHYLLRLCQSETTTAKAAEWLKKLGELYASHPSERERLVEREAESLADFSVITGFVNDLTSSTSLPTASRKKGHIFVTKSQELEAELAPIKMEIDLRDYAAPIDNLIEPGMADKAFDAMEAHTVQKAGATLGCLYQALAEECIADLEDQCEQAQARKEQDGKAEQIPVLATQEPLEEQMESRRHKQKTRPTQPSAFKVATNTPEIEEQEPAQMSQTLSGSESTMNIFMKIFKKSEARGSVSWVSFEAAMADLGFSVHSKYSSVYTFRSLESMAIRKPVTLHRPHNGQVEGVRLLTLALRLKRTYGWSEQTFQVA
ncbi:Ipa protein [Fusarium falciforme]|uniref:Ipa protein n=1 Tax=Fusarium falciforme TaxID=195108 RepID=UPI0023006A13|nr:Ipa protein [Fusarium falciforme]WAO84637.1 Ipa protein [Fusarium falciforme]